MMQWKIWIGKEEKINMSEYGHCNDCGGTNGHHFNDCTYDGVDSGRGYSSNTPDAIKWILLIGSVVFMGLIPPIGVILFTIFLLI